MQITKCTPSKSHIALGELFNLAITVKMGSGESLPSSGPGSFLQFAAAAENHYSGGGPDGFYDVIDLMLQSDGYVHWIENPGIGTAGSKAFTLNGLSFPADWPTAQLSDGGAARAYPFAILASGYNYNGGKEYHVAHNNVAAVLMSRVNPVINGVAMTDLHVLNPLGHFGDYIQGRSLPRIAADVTLDPLDPTLTATHTLTLTQGGNTVYTASNGTGIFEPGALAVIGTVDWSYTVTDSTGRSASTSDSFEVLPYAAPVISTLRAERYKVVLDDVGNPTYPAADDGELVRFTVSADVASVVGLNAWTLDITYGVAGSGVTTTVTPLTGTDGSAETIRRIDDRTLLTAAIPASADYDFAVDLADFFGPVRLVVSVYKAGGYFNIEKFGTGAGMRTTGTPENPCSDFAWPVKAWAGMVDGDGNELGLDRYSTDERVVGTWIDGKPIYRQVYTFTGTTASGQTKTIPLGHPVSYYDTIISVRGIGNTGGAQVKPLPHADSSSYYIICDLQGMSGSDPSIRILCAGSAALSGGGYVILEYTRAD